MRAVLYFVVPIGALLVAVAIWTAVLPACAAAPWLGRFTRAECPPPPTATATALAAEQARTRALTAELQTLERDLTALSMCERAPIIREGYPLDADKWDARDVGLLDGCWLFGGDLARASPPTGEVATADTWRVCFDGAGAGTQEIAFSDGAMCSGPINASFGDDGLLEIEDGAPAQCTPGEPLSARRGACAMDVYSRAICTFSDGASTTDITLHRAP